MRLVIVESPKKARTIQGFLGPGYRVAASMGHVRDLPPKELGVDVAHDFTPKYAVLPGSTRALAALRQAAAGAERVLLATDPDREGEAIAWHLTQALRLARSRFQRITFHEISRRAIQEALAHPRDLDPHLIDAQQARRVLDRLVGYQISPLLWRKVQRGTSAGRVQSVAVRLVVDREREILAFVPEEYWTIDVRLSAQDDPSPKGQFLARLQAVDGKPADIPDADTAAELVVQLKASAYRVRDVGHKSTTRNPFPPFTTSTLQQAAGNRLRLGAKKTMAAAQALYEAGLITYMRTDSVAVSAAAIAQAREVIAARFGAPYLPDAPRRYVTRAKNAQEAHEAIRPVDLAKTPPELRGTLAGDEWRVYELIWKRMLASQMAAARYRQDVAMIDARWRPEPLPAAQLWELPGGAGWGLAGGAGRGQASGANWGLAGGRRFLLKAQATTLLFPGWLALYGEDAAGPTAPRAARTGRSALPPTARAAAGADGSAPTEPTAPGESAEPAERAEPGDAGEAPANERLPALAAGQPLRLHEALPAQHFTQPPRRFTEASLVKALEEAGVGRPSTYATIVSTILDRGYVQLEQRAFVPTELGYAANDFLVAHFPRIVDLPFTAQMEDELDEIAGGRRQWTQMLQSFYGPFAATVAQAQGAPVTTLKRQEPPASARPTPRSSFPGAAGAKPPGEKPRGAGTPARKRRPPAPKTTNVVRARSTRPARASAPAKRASAPQPRPWTPRPRPTPQDDPLLDQLPF